MRYIYVVTVEAASEPSTEELARVLAKTCTADRTVVETANLYRIERQVPSSATYTRTTRRKHT